MRISRPRRQRTLLLLPKLCFESCPRRIGHVALVHHRPTSSGDLSVLFAPRAVPHSNAFCMSAAHPQRFNAARCATCHLTARRSVTATSASPAAVLSAQSTAPHRLAALDTSRLTFFCRQRHPQHLLRRVGDSIGSGCSPQSLPEYPHPHGVPPHHRPCASAPPLVASLASTVSSPCQLPLLG
jgi:hypothetical protein